MMFRPDYTHPIYDASGWRLKWCLTFLQLTHAGWLLYEFRGIVYIETRYAIEVMGSFDRLHAFLKGDEEAFWK